MATVRTVRPDAGGHPVTAGRWRGALRRSGGAKHAEQQQHEDHEHDHIREQIQRSSRHVEVLPALKGAYSMIRIRCLEHDCGNRIWLSDDEFVSRTNRGTESLVCEACRAEPFVWDERFTFWARSHGPGLAADQTAYWSEHLRCWYVPVAGEMLEEHQTIEPARVELRDGQLWITRLTPDPKLGAK
jgi:hypothetical protein